MQEVLDFGFIFLDLYVLLLIFSVISGHKMGLKTILCSELAMCLQVIILGTLAWLFDIDVLTEILATTNYPIFFLLYTYFVLKVRQPTLVVFYGFFAVILSDLLYTFMLYFIYPNTLFEQWAKNQISMERSILSILSGIIVLIFLKSLKYDFAHLRSKQLAKKNKVSLWLLNISMIFYYLFIEILDYYHMNTHDLRYLLVGIYLLILLCSLNIFDRNLRQELQEELVRQKEFQLESMQQYSRQVEGLYQEVRSFRHDYSNILSSLRLGIEAKDMDTVKTVYNEVLKESGKPLKNTKFEIGRLRHIEDVALKSLLASKFSEARNLSIPVSLEIPQMIAIKGIEQLDLLTIASIFLDNALESTSEVGIVVSYLEIQDKQVFIVQNGTREETIDTSQLFNRGYSSKGEGRGIGLSNVRAILNKYPHITLTTSSASYSFRQILEISTK